MKILFIGKRHDEEDIGIEKKMTGQINGLKALGHEVSYVFARKNLIILKNHDGKEEELIHYRENWISIYWAYEEGIKRIFNRLGYSYDMCYIRKTLCSSFHLSALKEIKKNGVKIVEEIPTYPYDAELLNEKGIVSKIYFLIDCLGRNRFKKYVDYFVTYSKDEEIFGVKTICIDNGIDVESIPIKEKKNVNDKEVRLITVSTMQFWHGYDRLIKGLAKFYANKANGIKVYVDMIGDGKERLKWKNLSIDLDIEEYVVFHGMKSGEKLTQYYNKSDLAVSSLGLHRIGIEAGSPLKMREYISRGIPVIYAGKDYGLSEELPFALNVCSDESDVDIEKIIEFYQNNNKEAELETKMREYAINNFTWKRQMEIILKTIGV